MHETRTSAASLLTVERLTHTIERQHLLDAVSFSMKRGEYAAIVGPNGAGKTTLLRCLVGILAATSGSIRLDGRDIATLSRKSSARRIAYLQQEQSVAFAFTVREIVAMGRYPHLATLAPATEADDEIVAAAMEEIGVAEFARRRLDTLSGGERQKVFLAAVIAQEPELLLLDEPTTFLDYRHQREIGAVLRRLHREKGVTILEITHDVNRAVLDADHLVALKAGRVVFDGTADGLMRPEILHDIYGCPFELVKRPGGGKMIVAE